MNKNITPTNAKGQPHGLWEYYWNNGKIWYKCVFINGKEIGFEEYHNDDDGKLTNKRYYL